MKNFKKITSLFLALLMIASTAVAITINSAADTVTPLEPEADGNYYVDDKADFLALAAAINADTTETTYFDGETVYLRGDIDLSGTTYSNYIITQFKGTLDGQGYAIKNLKMENAATGINLALMKDSVGATFQNIRFENCNVKADRHAAIITRAASVNGTTTTFRNVYVEGRVEATNANAAGFVSYNGAGCDVIFENCVSNCTVVGKRSSGFISQTNGPAEFTFKDCAFIGDLSGAGQWSATFCALTTGGNFLYERCVSLGKFNSSDGGLFIFLDHQNGSNKDTQTMSLVMNDCYAATTDSNYIVGAQSTRSYANPLTMSLKYNGAEAYSLTATNTNTVYANRAATEEALNAKNAYIARGDVNIFTAEKFAELCPALAASGKWAVTTQTVDYADGKNITKIMPASVAAMIDAPVATAPNATSYLQIKNGTDGKYDVRFIGAVNADDLAAYETVGFVVVVKLNGTAILTENVETKAVYTSIKADGVDVTAETLGADYLNVLQIAGFKADNKYDITVLSFAKRTDGTTVYDYAGALEVTVQNAAVAQ